MKSASKLLLYAIVLTIASYVHQASAANLDSLEKAINAKTITDQERISIYNDLSWGYLSEDFEKSKQYAIAGIAIAEKTKNLLMSGTLYRNLGVAYYMVSQHDTCLLYTSRCV